MSSTNIVSCRARVAADCDHGRGQSEREWEDQPWQEDNTFLVHDPETGDGTVICDGCYLALLPHTPSGRGLDHELPAAIAAMRLELARLEHLATQIEMADGHEQLVALHFDGDTFEPPRDAVRLTKEWWDVWCYMSGGQWATLREISMATGHPEASVSARLRDFRKPRFGSHTVEKEYVADGLWHYRLVRNEQITIEGSS